MKQILVELDDRCARDLEKVAPVKKRLRAEFVRRAIRSAIDVALDRATREAYERDPLPPGTEKSGTLGWDEDNALAKRAVHATKSSRRRVGSKRPTSKRVA